MVRLEDRKVGLLPRRQGESLNQRFLQPSADHCFDLSRSTRSAKLCLFVTFTASCLSSLRNTISPLESLPPNGFSTFEQTLKETQNRGFMLSTMPEETWQNKMRRLEALRLPNPQQLLLVQWIFRAFQFLEIRTPIPLLQGMKFNSDRHSRTDRVPSLIRLSEVLLNMGLSHPLLLPFTLLTVQCQASSPNWSPCHCPNNNQINHRDHHNFHPALSNKPKMSLTDHPRPGVNPRLHLSLRLPLTMEV